MSDIRWFTLKKSDGTSVTAGEFKSTIHVHSLENPGATMPGLSSFKLKSGMALNRNKDGSFTVVQTGEVLTLE